jgi:hypothetical protein
LLRRQTLPVTFATAANPSRQQEAVEGSPFLRLAPEIRNKIYQYCLVEPSLRHCELSLAQPPLTRTNRQIRSEALPIYYGGNRFYLKIPTEPVVGEKDDWADFIRMFRVFKASRTGGPGTGSLRFMRNVMTRIHPGPTDTIMCLSITLFALPDRFPRNTVALRVYGSDSGSGQSETYDWRDWGFVYEKVKENLIQFDEIDEIFMPMTCVRRFIATIVMIATECPGATEQIMFYIA